MQRYTEDAITSGDNTLMNTDMQAFHAAVNTNKKQPM